MLSLGQIPGNTCGQRMFSLTKLQSAPELMRLPWIYTITANTGLGFGGVRVRGHTWLMAL